MARKVSKKAKVVAIVLFASLVLAVLAVVFRARNAPFAFLKTAKPVGLTRYVMPGEIRMHRPFEMREDFADVHTAARQELSPYEGWIEEPLMETNHGHRLAYFARGDEAVVISEGPSDPSIIVIRVSRKATIEDHVLWFVSGRREYR